MDLLLHRTNERSLRAAAVCSAVAGFVLLTSLGALVRIPLPFSPVPITLQTFFVLLSGAFLGACAGPGAQMLYLVLGISGIPVFTFAGSGVLYFCGPTGGYLAGFVLAALICGVTARVARGFAGLCAGFLFASAVILACGTLWLSFVTGVSPWTAAWAGAFPFIPGDMVKSVAAAVIFARARRFSRA